MRKNFSAFTDATTRRKHERGAALITMLLVATLLLVAGGALIASTAMSWATSANATPEAQAYYAAEAGLQATLNALRGNVAPSPLPTPTPASGEVPPEDQLTFRGALTRSISNLSTDPTTLPDGSSFPMRLSKWLRYDYTPSGLAYADRVTLGPSPYSPLTGMAYSVTVSELTNLDTVTYSSSATFTGGGTSYTYTNAGNSVTIIYLPQVSTTVTAIPPVSTGLGSFVVTRTGNGGDIPADIKVNLRINVSAPYEGSIIIGGTITGKVTATSCNLKIAFSSKTARVSDTLFELASNPFQMNAASGGGTFALQTTVTAPEPRRLLIQSTGYGPRGAQKRLEMLVSRYKYDIQPPAPVVIRGSDDGTTMTFNLGSSNAKKYSGKDNSKVQPKFPTIAISLHDWYAANDGIVKGATVDDPKLSILDIDAIPSPWPSTLTPVPSNTPTPPTPAYPFSAQTPSFLQTANNARAFLNDIEATARARGRYFSTLTGYAGSLTSPDLTFVDGNCTLSGGAGLLIVTGNLEMTGNDDFKGVILVLGSGRVTRSGTGNGRVLGSWMIASFSRTGTGGFTAPSFNVSGGGNGSFLYDTASVDAANKTAGGSVLGIAER